MFPWSDHESAHSFLPCFFFFVFSVSFLVREAFVVPCSSYDVHIFMSAMLARKESPILVPSDTPFLFSLEHTRGSASCLYHVPLKVLVFFLFFPLLRFSYPEESRVKIHRTQAGWTWWLWLRSW